MVNLVWNVSILCQNLNVYVCCAYVNHFRVLFLDYGTHLRTSIFQMQQNLLCHLMWSWEISRFFMWIMHIKRKGKGLWRNCCIPFWISYNTHSEPKKKKFKKNENLLRFTKIDGFEGLIQAACSMQSKLLFRLLLKNIVRKAHRETYPKIEWKVKVLVSNHFFIKHWGF